MTLYATLASLLFGLFCVIMGIRQCFHSLVSSQWPSVPGTIIRSKLITFSSDYDPSHSLDLRYQFNLNGQDYKGHRISFRPIGNLASRKSMERYTEKYGKGDRISVF